MSWIRRRPSKPVLQADPQLSEERFVESERLRLQAEATVAHLQERLAALATSTQSAATEDRGTAQAGPEKPLPQARGASKLLVIGSQRTNYAELFAGQTVHGKVVQVEQCRWDELSLCSQGRGGLLASIAPSAKPLPNTNQARGRSFQPDFVLLRAGCMGGFRVDWRHMLSVLAHSGVGAVNSVESFIASQDKALVYGRLRAVQRRLGGDFPLIVQDCYSDWRAATFPPDMPTVAKVGTASGGLGKMRVRDADDWRDFCGCCAMQPQYFTSEPFVEWVADVRVQKIGSHVRAVRRTGKDWKANMDASPQDEDVAVEPRWRKWVDAAARALGADICALDLLCAQSKEGVPSEHILEVNSSAIGLVRRHAEEDERRIRDLVLQRMAGEGEGALSEVDD